MTIGKDEKNTNYTLKDQKLQKIMEEKDIGVTIDDQLALFSLLYFTCHTSLSYIPLIILYFSIISPLNLLYANVGKFNFLDMIGLSGRVHLQSGASSLNILNHLNMFNFVR